MCLRVFHLISVVIRITCPTERVLLKSKGVDTLKVGDISTIHHNTIHRSVNFHFFPMEKTVTLNAVKGPNHKTANAFYPTAEIPTSSFKPKRLAKKVEHEFRKELVGLFGNSYR